MTTLLSVVYDVFCGPQNTVVPCSLLALRILHQDGEIDESESDQDGEIDEGDEALTVDHEVVGTGQTLQVRSPGLSLLNGVDIAGTCRGSDFVSFQATSLPKLAIPETQPAAVRKAHAGDSLVS